MNKLSEYMYENEYMSRPLKNTPKIRHSPRSRLIEIEMDESMCEAYVLVQSDIHKRLKNLYIARKYCKEDELKINIETCILLEKFIDYNNNIINTNNCYSKINKK